MAQIAEAQIKINVPINSVYSFVCNLENLPYFWPKITEVEKDPQTPDATGAGTKYFIYSNTLFGNKKKAEVELVTSTAHSNFEYREPSGVLTGYYFSEENDGTLVKMYRKTELGALASLLTLSLISSRDSKIELEKTLSRLKVFLEAENYKESGEEKS